MTLGRVGEITPDQARTLARDRLAEVRHGTDPLSDRQTKRRELKLSEFIDQWEADNRSEEHTSELQSLMRISYAVFCLKKKQKRKTKTTSALTSKMHNSVISNIQKCTYDTTVNQLH